LIEIKEKWEVIPYPLVFRKEKKKGGSACAFSAYALLPERREGRKEEKRGGNEVDAFHLF